MGRGLSEDQRQAMQIIGDGMIRLGDWADQAEVEGDPDASIIRCVEAEGAFWRSGATTASRRASWSRTLRRLEARGLVIRRNRNSDCSPRTTNVQLTVAGWAVYAEMTGVDVARMTAGGGESMGGWARRTAPIAHSKAGPPLADDGDDDGDGLCKEGRTDAFCAIHAMRAPESVRFDYLAGVDAGKRADAVYRRGFWAQAMVELSKPHIAAAERGHIIDILKAAVPQSDG